MRIGYLIPEFPGQTHAFFWREAQAMEEAGAEIHFLSTRRPAPQACPHAFRQDATARTHYVFPPTLGAMAALLGRPAALFRGLGYVLGLRETPLPARLKLLALLGAAAELNRFCKRAGLDHLHIHSCANAAHLGALNKRFGGPGYSLTLHGDLPVYGTDHIAKMAPARFVSAVTRPLARDIHALLPDLRAPVIWMGVDCDRFQPDTTRQNRSDAPFTVLTVARLNRTKGHRYTLQAIADLVGRGHDIQFRIVGTGPEDSAIRNAIAEFGLEDRVTMLGALDETGVRDEVQSADALALTSFGEGEAAPVVVMEAMACGCPVVVSRIGGTPDMIEDRTDGYLVPQQDAPAIGAALEQLASDPDLRHRMGTAARQTALEKFDFRANAKRLLGEIQQTTGMA